MNIQEIQEQLERLPDAIRDQENKVIEAEYQLEIAKLNYDVAFTHHLLDSSRPNATEKKAEAVQFTGTEKRELIESERKLGKEKSGQNHLENKFISVRKLSSLEERHFNPNQSGN